METRTRIHNMTFPKGKHTVHNKFQENLHFQIIICIPRLAKAI